MLVSTPRASSCCQAPHSIHALETRSKIMYSNSTSRFGSSCEFKSLTKVSKWLGYRQSGPCVEDHRLVKPLTDTESKISQLQNYLQSTTVKIFSFSLCVSAESQCSQAILFQFLYSFCVLSLQMRFGGIGTGKCLFALIWISIKTFL